MCSLSEHRGSNSRVQYETNTDPLHNDDTISCVENNHFSDHLRKRLSTQVALDVILSERTKRKYCVSHGVAFFKMFIK